LSGARFGAKAVREQLDEHGLRVSRSLGQNFLIDPNIPEKTVRLSGIGKSCGVLEVGPGLGALTSILCRTAGRVTAVEIDSRLLPILREALEGVDNVEIIQGDILKTDIAGLLRDKMPGMEYHVCANLPYNITTPVLSTFINSGLFETITVMVQREVARRICASPGSADYGAFTVFVNYHAKPEILFDVPPECFLPRPEVFSSVVKIVKRPERLLAAEDEAVFFRVVRAAFAQRRKTILNALFAAFHSELQKAEIEAIINSCGFDARIRGETLGIDEFMRLSANFS